MGGHSRNLNPISLDRETPLPQPARDTMRARLWQGTSDQLNRQYTMSTYKTGQTVHFRDFNLRHPSRGMTVIKHIGDTVTVKHHSGVTGDWLSRDLS